MDGSSCLFHGVEHAQKVTFSEKGRGISVMNQQFLSMKNLRYGNSNIETFSSLKMVRKVHCTLL